MSTRVKREEKRKHQEHRHGKPQWELRADGVPGLHKGGYRVISQLVKKKQNKKTSDLVDREWN